MNDDEFVKQLNNMIKEINSLAHNDEIKKDKILKRLTMLIRNKLGEDSIYINEIETTNFSFYPPSRLVSGKDYSIEYKNTWENGKRDWINTLEIIIDEVNLFSKAPRSTNIGIKNFNKVFIVHGHDEEMLHATARFLEKLNLESVVLREQPNQGRTIIEKFEDYSDVDFAIVLFSPDDLGKSKNDENLKLRPRQNVVFELGFFIGKLSRKNVVVLHRTVQGFDMLSDFQGVLFQPYNEGWEYKIAKELKSVGFNIGFELL